MHELKFDIPWYKEFEKESIENQLYLEVGEQHTLFNKKVTCIARRQDRDDVLFYVESINQYALVHLTWAQKKLMDKNFPSAKFFNSIHDVQKIIDADTKDWITAENTPADETGGFIKGKKRIIIVGASSGIGREIAKQYALEGNLVGITARRAELLKNLEKSFSGRMVSSVFDVTKDPNSTHLKNLVKKLGGLDLLIISAGTGEPSKELSWETDKKTTDTNVNGFIEIANWSFNYFVRQGYGQLATISSIAANRGGSWAPAYNASKAFQSNYFEGLAIKATKMGKNISVTCIEPGFVATKMAQSDKLFWVVPVDKAARQIIRAIEKRKRKVYISRRWWIIAKLMKWAPYWLYKKVG